MDKEVRDREVSLELCRKTATPDYRVLPKAGTGPSGPHWTRGTKRHDPTASEGGLDVYWLGAGKLER